MSGDRWAGRPYVPITDTTPPGDTSIAQGAGTDVPLSRGMVLAQLVCEVQPYLDGTECIDEADGIVRGLLGGPLSDRRVVEQIPGAAWLVRELDEARKTIQRVKEIVDEMYLHDADRHESLFLLRSALDGTP